MISYAAPWALPQPIHYQSISGKAALCALGALSGEGPVAWTVGFPSVCDYSAILEKWLAHVPPPKLHKPCALSEGGQGPLIKQIVRGLLNRNLAVTPVSEGLSEEAERTT